jgi:hypothetical protein
MLEYARVTEEFLLEVLWAEPGVRASVSLEAITFGTYSDLSQYVRDAIEWGIQVSNVRYKVGNVILDGRNVYIVVGKETY